MDKELGYDMEAGMVKGLNGVAIGIPHDCKYLILLESWDLGILRSCRGFSINSNVGRYHCCIRNRSFAQQWDLNVDPKMLYS